MQELLQVFFIFSLIEKVNIHHTKVKKGRYLPSYHCLQIPESVLLADRSTMSGLEVLCIALQCFRYQCSYGNFIEDDFFFHKDGLQILVSPAE